MPYRNAEFTQGQYYHVYNRGAGKSKIFYTEDNYRYLLELMRRYLGKYGISVIAYCLMPNHYHFLLLQLTDMPISKFINVLFNAYVQALNLQQSRTGTFTAPWLLRLGDSDLVVRLQSVFHHPVHAILSIRVCAGER